MKNGKKEQLKALTLRLPEKTHDKLSKKAINAGLGLSTYIRNLIMNDLMGK
jgi:predicted HicB family RNase H-like nuclease